MVGLYAWRRDGEHHQWNPETIALLQHAVRARRLRRRYEEYSQRGQRRQRAPPHDARAARVPVRRTTAASRSTTSSPRRRSSSASSPARCRSARISREAHETLAIAMNRIGGKLEHRRGRRGSGALRAGRERRLAPLGDQAGRVGPVRREHRLPDERRRAADQDGAGREARRGRPAAGPQGRRLHRRRPADDAGRRPDLAAAAPRHLLDRGPEAADLRPALREPAGADLGEARRRGRRRHGRRRRRQGERRPRADLRSRRRHRRLAALVDPLRRHPVGDRPRRDPADAGAERPALAHLGADRRAAEDGPRRGDRRAARRRRDGLRNRTARRERLRDDARLPPEHVPGRASRRRIPSCAAASRASPSTSSTSSSSSPRRRGGSWPGSASRSSRI